MKIDYAEIIEKANVRKEQLQTLEVLLEEASSRVAEIQNIVQWVTYIGQAHSTLDQEGRNMLPEGVRSTLTKIGDIGACLNRSLIWNDGYSPAGIKLLVTSHD